MEDLNSGVAQDSLHNNAIIITTGNPWPMTSVGTGRISTVYFEVFDENKNILGSITGDQLNIALNRTGFTITNI